MVNNALVPSCFILVGLLGVLVGIKSTFQDFSFLQVLIPETQGKMGYKSPREKGKK